MDERPKFRIKLKRTPAMPGNPRMTELREHPSIDSGHTGAVTTGVKPQFYTGEKIIGISVMAKSNLVPVFSKEALMDISTMRR